MALSRNQVEKLDEIQKYMEEARTDQEYFQILLEGIETGKNSAYKEVWSSLKETVVRIIREYETSIGRMPEESALNRYQGERLVRYAAACRQYLAFGKETDQCLAGELNPRNAVWVCNTPPVFGAAGCRSLPMLLTQSHAKNSVRHRTQTNSHYHGLTMEEIRRLPEALETPAVIMGSATRKDALLAVLGYRDRYGQPVVAAVVPEGKGVYGLQKRRSNFILSVYGKEDVGRLIQHMHEENKIYYMNEERSRELALPLLSLQRGNKNLASNFMIKQKKENVNLQI
jgi:hypothetical protein